MEGAEKYDFFRQPDFVPDPFLKGSYAVYKKVTLLGEGTGKLCHIHRPEIIDARGRRCWGDLAVVGNCLCITIPETWLSEAAYPVIVDPTIGTTTVGSMTKGVDPINSAYDRPMIDGMFAFNKFAVSQRGGGNCTAYIYTYYDDTDNYVLPCVYSDFNSKPYQKKSRNEKDINVYVKTGGSASWKSGTFSIEGVISAGDNIWFGIAPAWFTTRYDYGGVCRYLNNNDDYETYDGWELPEYIINDDRYDLSSNIKWSWYFTYEAINSQNYTRTIA